MDSWALRRKAVYLGALVLLLSATSFWIFWQFWYSPPTCFDGLQNGGEQGVDCGGPCTLVCQASALDPIIRWDPRVFEISSGTWSALVYVENPNTNVDASYLPYRFTFYDDNNKVLAEREGATILPKNRTVGIFEGAIITDNKEVIKRAIFEIDRDIAWSKNDKPPLAINVNHSPLLRANSAPRVEANVKNNSIEDIENIELIITVFDGADNAVAASRTFIESLQKNEDANVVFTWPQPFNLGTKICQQSSDVILLLDRSGSMAALNLNPPEPLTSVKTAAVSFIDQLGRSDRVGIVSFATEATNPIDFSLSEDVALAKEAVQSIRIKSDATQYTNIQTALQTAWQELLSPRASEESSKVIVLLTDGVATHPKDPQGTTEDDDINYAQSLARKMAEDIEKDNIVIYTIGLGDEINEIFLKQVATEDSHYFYAPQAKTLISIYNQISSRICQELPARIEITHRIFGSSI